MMVQLGALRSHRFGRQLVLAAATCIAGMVILPWRAWLHELDRQILHERLMDTLAVWRSDEDWATAEPLRQPQDYRWRAAGGRPVRVAHALGEANLPDAKNTLAAMHRAHDAGLRIFEVDLWQEGDVLRCHHGPEAPPPLQADSCRFDALLAELPADSWLVLDIKTDFATAGTQVVRTLQRQGRAAQVVFQLYAPGHLALFRKWQSMVPLPGPIITAYLAHRRMDHVSAYAARTGVQVLTLPIERLAALTVRPRNLALYLHPVHDCTAWREAMHAHVEGVYSLTGLKCPDGSEVERR